MTNEIGTEDAHESGKDDELGFKSVDQFDQGGIEGLTTFESLVIERAGIDTRFSGTLQDVGVGAVGNHRADADRVVPGQTVVDQSLQVAAGAGKQHHYITGGRHLLAH